MRRTRPTRETDRPGDARVQRSLLVVGTALFLVGLATLSGAFGAGIAADEMPGSAAVGDALLDTPTARGGATDATPGADGSATEDTGTPIGATPTPATGGETPAGDPMATPTPTESDDSILGGIVDWSTRTPTPTPGRQTA